MQTSHGALEKRVIEVQSANSAAEKRSTDAHSALDKRLKEEHQALLALNGRYEETSATVARLAGYAGPQGAFPGLSSRLNEDMAALIKELSEKLKSESTARTELAAEFTRYKAAAPAAKEEAEENLRVRVRALVVELLPSLAPAAPLPSGAPAPPPAVREWKLVEHRCAMALHFFYFNAVMSLICMTPQCVAGGPYPRGAEARASRLQGVAHQV